MFYLTQGNKYYAEVYTYKPDSLFIETETLPKRPEEKNFYYLQLCADLETKDIWWTYVLLPEFINKKIEEVYEKCGKIITDGIDVETSYGIKHFRLDITDQQNFLSLDSEVSKAVLGRESVINLEVGIPYHADNDECRYYSHEDFNKIMKTSFGHVFYNTTYHNFLKEYIRDINDINELNSVYYGIPLPDKYNSKLINIINAK